MKTKILLLAVTTFCTALIFTACQKNTSSSVDETTQVSTEADDQSTVSTEADNATNDADVMVEATSAFSGRGYDIQSLICDAT
ncbi:MAG TPA: hypothetical protein VET23_04620, partial [Chitinophagaceae bacterium]|nr:hypothetical protein [Chitinophagaceae bacterium]